MYSLDVIQMFYWFKFYELQFSGWKLVTLYCSKYGRESRFLLFGLQCTSIPEWTLDPQRQESPGAQTLFPVCQEAVGFLKGCIVCV